MSWPVLPHGFLGSQATGDNDTYRIERSLRFNSADSAYLSRTPASAGNRKTWTWSGWVKRSKTAPAGTHNIWVPQGATFDYLAFENDCLTFNANVTSAIRTNAVYRDLSAWYHIVVVYDSPQATSSNRMRLYVNGIEVTSLQTAIYPSQNADSVTNSTNTHYIGSNNTPSNIFDGYLTEINFIDGQALTPSSFGETDAITGRWKAKAYTGDYGANGFYLNFSDNSGTTATTLGKDSAPISGTHTAANNWTPNNFSVTAGTGNDSLTDSPSNYGTISTALSDDTYQISRSLRFNSADSAYLSRTPASAGNRKTWTWSGWVKRSGSSTYNSLWGSESDSCFMYWDNTLYFFNITSGGGVLRTTNVFRDFSAWYHVVLAVDTTQATSANRVRIYVNNQEITTFSTATYPPQNGDTYTNQASVASYVGANRSAGLLPFDGYLTEIHFIDGQALTPDSFGVRDASTYLWKPKAYTGTYGTNGFYLNFSDNSGATATTLGKDQAGSNNWTPNNFSVASGVGNDSLVDTPTYYGTDSGVGGEVRGNYCTLNALDNGGLTLANGNLDASRATASWASVRSSVGISSGKWYWEITPTSGLSVGSTTNQTMIGISKSSAPLDPAVGTFYGSVDGWGYYFNTGQKWNNNVGTNYGATYTNNDVIGVAFDADNGTLTFYKNNTSQGTAFSGLTSGPYFPTHGHFGTASSVANFGQRPFAYAAPSGFRALRDYNKIPVPTGGVVRGNYATWNPLNRQSNIALSNGGLDTSSSATQNWRSVVGTIGMMSGKWYWEATANATGGANYYIVGIATTAFNALADDIYVGINTVSWGYYGNNGTILTNNGNTSYGNSYTTNDVVGVAYDADNGKIFFSKNGTWQNSGSPSNGTNPAFSGLTGTMVPATSGFNGSGMTHNFGQRPWAYDAPFGFLPLCTALLPTPTIKKPSSYMDVVTYTGNGSTQTISGLGFSPDLVWIKMRSAAYSHVLQDRVRGAYAYLVTNSTQAENTNTSYNWFREFTNNGFTVARQAADSTITSEWNENSATYVAWAWDEAPIAGMDIVSYTGNGTTQNVSHALGVKPAFIISKNRTNGTGNNWGVYHKSLTSSQYIYLNLTNAASSSGANTAWGNNTSTVEPTSSVFTVGNSTAWNENSSLFIAYLFAEVEGFSKFGSYTGNGSSDGPFVWCGFRPRWVMIKRTDASGTNWEIWDSARNTSNLADLLLLPSSSGAEGTFGGNYGIDILSNGFKCRGIGSGLNGSGETLIFAAFAESPFKYARAR